MKSVFCKAGRLYDSNHVTCKSCERQGAGCQQPTEKASKYHSKKVITEEGVFDSKREYARWLQLKIMERAGAITDLKRQVVYELQPAVVLDGRKKPALRYKADAVYKENGLLVVEDTKSPATRMLPLYRTKKHLMKTILGHEIQET